jgi:putative aldouronate transport system permease protein
MTAPRCSEAGRGRRGDLRSASDRAASAIACVVVGLFALLCLYPLALTVMASVSDNREIVLHGFSLAPRALSLDTYRYLWDTARENILNAYVVTIAVTVVGTLFSVLVTSLMAYALSLRYLRYRNVLAMASYLTVLFSAGIVPWYLVCVRVLHIENTLFGLFLPYAVNVWFLFLLRNYFQAVPEAIIESAKIDGASELRTWSSIAVPSAQTGVLTIALFYALQYWNDWWLAIMLITRKALFPLQYYLFATLTNVQALSKGARAGSVPLPTETVKMGITVVTIGPVILLYPLVQKYFVKGIIVGAVKG